MKYDPSVPGSRDLLVESGLRIAARGAPDDLMRVLHTDSVCAAASVSRRTFYDQFPSTQDFRDEVLARIRSGVAAAEPFDPDDALADGADLPSLLGAIFDWFGDVVETNSRLAFWGASADDGTEHAIAVVVDSLINAGYRIANGVSRNGLVTALATVGSAVGRRSLSDDEGALLAAGLLSSSLLRHDERSRRSVDIAAMSAELRAARLFPADGMVRHLRRLVVDATLAEIERLGPDEVSLDDIAHRVGVSAAALAQTLGSITDLATIGIDELAFDIAPLVQADANEGRTQSDLLDRLGDRLAEILSTRPRLCEMVVTSDARGEHRPLRALARAAQPIVDAGPAGMDDIERGILILAALVGRGDDTPDLSLFVR